jgi:hypothetical protein
MMTPVRIPLHRAVFGESEKTVFESADFQVKAFSFPSGVAALTIVNSRGSVVVLPFMGQMIWSAKFDGCDLTMKNMFKQPRPATSILGAYGCFMFHSGLLRSGCPSPRDDHPLHGELPCAAMDKACIVVSGQEGCPFVRVESEVEYVQGFGDNYVARPSVSISADSALMEIGMKATNLAAKPMELMYMAHMNYAYVPNAEFCEPLGFERCHVRTSVPAHVKPTAAWTSYVGDLSQGTRKLNQLDDAKRYDPEIVFFFDGVRADPSGNAHFFLKHPSGAAFYTRYQPQQLNHAARWVLHNADQSVAAFVLPATCEPEGYLSESAKGNVRKLAPGETVEFSVTTGYLNGQERTKLERSLQPQLA